MTKPGMESKRSLWGAWQNLTELIWRFDFASSFCWAPSPGTSAWWEECPPQGLALGCTPGAALHLTGLFQSCSYLHTIACHAPSESRRVPLQRHTPVPGSGTGGRLGQNDSWYRSRALERAASHQKGGAGRGALGRGAFHPLSDTSSLQCKNVCCFLCLSLASVYFSS